MHSKTNPYDRCHICNKEIHKKDLEIHLLDFHSESSNGTNCDLCGGKFININQHIRQIHKNDIDKKFVCGLCEKSYSRKQNLDLHVKYIHEKQNFSNHICEKCGKSFRTSSLLDAHFTSVHIRSKKIECEKCGRNMRY